MYDLRCQAEKPQGGRHDESWCLEDYSTEPEVREVIGTVGTDGGGGVEG